VRGVTTRTGFKLTEEQDLIFEPGDVPTQFAYGAFGHIHKAQEVLPNTPWMRYSGSIERLDGGERDDEKSVALIEVGPGGRVGEVKTLPLESTPFEFVTLDAAKNTALTVIEGLERQWETHPNRTRVLVKMEGTYLPGRDNVYQIRRRLAALFPRLYAVDLRPVPVEAGGSILLDGPVVDIRDVEKTATEYIADTLKNDPRREPILALLCSLLRPSFAPPSAADPAPKIPLPAVTASESGGSRNDETEKES
jgi:DNA repair protein SbcD/Mre11